MADENLEVHPEMGLRIGGGYLRFGCPECVALCCRYSRVFLYPEKDPNDAAIAARMGLRPNEAGELILSEANQTCSLLDQGTNRCSVYEDRPLACRQYTCMGDIWQSVFLVTQAIECSKPLPTGFAGATPVLWACSDNSNAKHLKIENVNTYGERIGQLVRGRTRSHINKE